MQLKSIPVSHKCKGFNENHVKKKNIVENIPFGLSLVVNSARVSPPGNARRITLLRRITTNLKVKEYK